jgi:hypothetical protein
MKLRLANCMYVGIAAVGSVFMVSGAAISPASGKENAETAVERANIAIEYPAEGSVFPPEITAPTFLWRDPSDSAKRWVIAILFADPSNGIRVESAGEPMRLGENDPRAGESAVLTTEQAATHTWKPDAETWAKIKRLSAKAPATITIAGFAESESGKPTSQGTVRISTSTDRVGAPVFYRDVPLMMSPVGDKGAAVDQVGAAEYWRATEPHSDGKPAHLRQLPLVLSGWQDDGARYGWPAKRQGALRAGLIGKEHYDPQSGCFALELVPGES